MLDEALKKVAILGAAGKMGSGISLLLLQEMARCELSKTGQVGSGDYCLTLIDTNEKALFATRRYLRAQLNKYAEKNITSLRQAYASNPSLISNEEIIRAFIEGTTDMIRLESEITGAKSSILIFEAIVEDFDIKTKAFSMLTASKKQDQFYFSNTSSIPISLLNKASKLDNRIIGYHFYNPPAVQKLLEIIAPDNVNPQLLSISMELAQRLQKKVVPSHDIAGFIGNGHFMREVLYACKTARQLAQEHRLPLSKAIYLINRVTQEYLLRPMGIFQLIDYVGIDVCQNIARIMNMYLPDPNFRDDLIDAMMSANVKGGQHADGTQKNGFFQYDKMMLTGVYSLDDKQYYQPWAKEGDAFLGERPVQSVSWKSLQQEKNKHARIEEYFQVLFQSKSVGSELAKNYLLESRRIAQNLVKDGVAERIEDVDAVLENGFFHLYGVGDLTLPQSVLARR